MMLLAPAATAGTQYKILYSFDGGYGVGGPKGGPPTAAPILDAHGNVYGPAGGGNGNSCEGPCGVIYKVAPDAKGKWHETVALNFGSHSHHGWPDSNLSFDGHGNLYGSLSSYWVFQMNPRVRGGDLKMIYHGYGTDVGGVIADGTGKVYGALGDKSNYRVTIGELSPGGDEWSYDALYTFCDDGDCIDGAFPRAPFSWGKDGTLYGTTFWGGNAGCYQHNGCGAAFQMVPNGDGTWKYSVAHRFAGTHRQDGENPWGGLVMGTDGNLYGTTFYGGPNAVGTVFKLTPSGHGDWRETLIYGFPNVEQGAFPWGNLVFDGAGNLYGVANGGGVCDGDIFCGQVFRLSPLKNGKWKYTVIHAFKGPDGAFPYGVAIDKQGNLFGTTLGGGANGYGVVFEITP